MVEQKFYQSQPEVLPATLPKGTRFRYYDAVWIAQEEMHLEDGGLFYLGSVRSECGSSSDVKAQSRLVDWVPPSEPADRLIQAGDWVECVDPGTATFLRQGEKYLVESVQVLDGTRCLQLLGSAIFWREFRFKRVEGPHPESGWKCPPHKFNAFGKCVECGAFQGQVPVDSSVPVGTGNAQSSGMGEVTICSECHAPARLDPDNGMCAYCCASTGHGDETRREQDAITRHSTDRHPRMAKPSERLEAWSRAEQPRVSAATRKMLAGHPASWPSCEGED